MISSTSSSKEKSKLTDHFKKFAFEKTPSDVTGKPLATSKKPDHEISDEENKSSTSSNRSTPSKHSSSSKNSTPSKHGSSSDSHRSSSHRSSGSHSSSPHKSSSSPHKSSSSSHKSSSSPHKSSSSSHKSSSHSKNDQNGVKPHHSISESDGDSRNSTPVKKSRIANRAQLEDSSDDDEPKRTFSRIKTFVAEKSSRKRIRAPDSGSGSDGDSKSSHSTVTSDRGKRRALNRDRRSPVIERKKKKKVDGSDEERWSDTVLVDSDEDESGKSKKATNMMTVTKTRVFEFMNDATKEELMLVNSVTSKKADMIIQNRPFKGWLDLLVKLKCEKYLGTDVLDNALEVLKSKHIVSRLMTKCLDLAVSTEKAVLEGGSTLKTQPAVLTPTMQLKSYQMIGLNWLVVMHKQKLNGILADEMGLGKTIQVVAFFAYLREARITNGPHLIVCPTSTIDNWAIEFTKWCPDIRVEIYHGSQDERKFLRTRWFKEKFKTMDVIVTSYQIVGSNAEERKMFKVMPLQYVVFDEAHMLKNMNTQRYGHLFSINATFRILLTGTPLQNNLLELMSLLNFVMPNMFSSKINYIKSFFSKRAKPGSPESVTDFEQEQVDLAKRIMKPFVMRRLKQDVLKDLPKKTNVVLKVTMDEAQKVKYNNLLEEIREIAQKQDSDNPQNFMSSFMQLRKLSNHPLTLRFHYQEETLREMASRLAADYGFKETNEDHIFEDLCYSSDHDIHKLTREYKCVGKFKLADSLFKGSGKFRKLDELLPKLKKEGHRVVMFSQFVFMLDLIEEYLRINNHEFCRLDGSTSMGDRQELIDDFNEDSKIFVFLLTTKAGGVGINLTSADTVIIHDVDFNPYNDKQAEDRCHRLGQTRPVQIIRMISEDTVEEKIYAMAQNKLNLEQELIGKDEEETETTKKVESLLKEVLGFVKKK